MHHLSGYVRYFFIYVRRNYHVKIATPLRIVTYLNGKKQSTSFPNSRVSLHLELVRPSRSNLYLYLSGYMRCFFIYAC
jgi:hypothetical protein